MPIIIKTVSALLFMAFFSDVSYAGRSLLKPVDFSREISIQAQGKPVRKPLKSELSTSQTVQGWKVWQTSSQLHLNERSFRLADPIPVYNERTRQVGKITGNIQLKLKSGTNSKAVLTAHRLQQVDAFPHLNILFVTSTSDAFDLPALVSQLKADSRIQSVDVEIVSRRYEKF